MSHTERPYRIAVVCLGNICRSPMAHVVLVRRIADAGLADHVEVDSAGTGCWHVGEPMDERAAHTLRERGYALPAHRARQFTRDWYIDHDLVLALDARNHADLEALAPDPAARARLVMFRSFDPLATPTDQQVPDPWFGGPEGFVDVLETIERTADALVERLPGLLAER